VYFNVNFNVFFKLIKVHLLVSEIYMLYAYLDLSRSQVPVRVTNSGFYTDHD